MICVIHIISLVWLLFQDARILPSQGSILWANYETESVAEGATVDIPSLEFGQSQAVVLRIKQVESYFNKANGQDLRHLYTILESYLRYICLLFCVHAICFGFLRWYEDSKTIFILLAPPN